MSLIFAVRWEPKGNHAFIEYMAINDKNFEYEIDPIKLEVNKNDFSKFDRITRSFFIKHKNAKLECKSVIRNSQIGRKPRSDSVKFDNIVRKIRSDCEIEEHPRLQKKLAGDNLNRFKNCLFSYRLLTPNKGEAWKYHLWTVALHVTRGTLDKTIRKIERSCND